MPFLNRAARGTLACAGLLGLLACDGAGGAAETPERLADVVVPDPDFTFATSKTVQLELAAPEGVASALEVTDADGRRVMDGAFLSEARLDLKVPVGTDRLTVRTGLGDEAVERRVDVGADGRAVAGR